MALHRYALGERVYVNTRQILAARASGVYKVVRQLPPEGGGDQQYRIKSESELYERVVPESQLSRVAE